MAGMQQPIQNRRGQHLVAGKQYFTAVTLFAPKSGLY
jgi:hypothetical protein